jgi:hypothetical protein
LADLETTVIMQDRQFLTEVARHLGLPVNEVLKRCLGTGVPQIAVVGSLTDSEVCPWWDKHGEGLWKPCVRQRLSPTSPCQVHAHTTNGRLGSTLLLPEAMPYRYEGEIYWVHDNLVFREDGSFASITFKFVKHRGQRICVRFNAPSAAS